jgi:hypothetical protein
MPEYSNQPKAPALARFRFSICAFKLSVVIILMSAFSSAGEDTAQQALDDARRLAREGKYEEALQKHVWFHDNALTNGPGYYGVRLSFALSDWAELGKKYPHALKVLRDIRDRKTSRLLDGEIDHHLFHDVSSINEYLKETKETVELFNKIDSRDSHFAAKVYDLADEALIEAKEFRLARKYQGDPQKRLVTATKNYQRGLDYSKKSIDESAARQAHERIFAEEAVRIITVLRETGDRPRAEQIQTEALKTLDAKEIKDALKN